MTNNQELANKIRLIRTHGVENVKDPIKWPMPGHNFRFNDLAASIGIEQLKKIPKRINQLKNIYEIYEKYLRGSKFKLIPVNLSSGEVPVYNEFLVSNRDYWINSLANQGIETRSFYPNINTANYLGQSQDKFLNSERFSKFGIYLPSGPNQEISSIKQTIKTIKIL